MSSEVKFNADVPCSACGRFGAYEFDGQWLCAECYEKRGSCCPEFGADDLWQDTPEAPAKKEPDRGS